MKKIKMIIGRVIYDIVAKHLPPSFYPINIGQKKLRAFCGKLILAECGKNVNIEKGAIFPEKFIWEIIQALEFAQQ